MGDLLSRGWAAWIETAGHGVRLDLGDEVILSTRARRRAAAGPPVHAPDAVARLRRFLRLTGLPPVLPEWAYGHWKSRDVYTHQSDAEADWQGYREHGIPLDAIVLDSPWATQYNTWEFNPHQFPDARGYDRALRADGVRTVVWVAPWVNLDSREGQYPPDDESGGCTASPRPTTSRRSSCGKDGEPLVARWWMGTGSPVDFTNARAEAWWREQAKQVLRLGVQGIKADDGEGWYIPDDARFADGTTGAQTAWGHGLQVPPLDAARARRGPPGRGRALRPPGVDRASRRSASPGAATSRATSGRCGRSSPRR